MLRTITVVAESNSGEFEPDGFVLEGSPMPGGWNSASGRLMSALNYKGGLPERMDRSLRYMGGIYNTFLDLGILNDVGDIATKKLTSFLKMDMFRLVLQALYKDPLGGLKWLTEVISSLEKKAPQHEHTRAVGMMVLSGAISDEVVSDFLTFAAKNYSGDNGGFTVYRSNPTDVRLSYIDKDVGEMEVIGGFHLRYPNGTVIDKSLINWSAVAQILADGGKDAFFKFILDHVVDVNLNAGCVSIPIGACGVRYHISYAHEGGYATKWDDNPFDVLLDPDGTDGIELPFWASNK